MVLQSSGAISLNDIQNEFGGSNPIGINEYYGVASGIPGSGTISLNQFYGASSDTWEIIMHTDGYKGSGNNIGNSTAFGETGTSLFKTHNATSTGAYNRRQIGHGVGLYAAFFYKKNIKRFALISGSGGQNNLQSYSSHSSYHVWDTFTADRDRYTDTGNESLHEIIDRLDTYNLNNANWGGNDSAFTGKSIRNFTTGTNGYSTQGSSAYPNPATMTTAPLSGGGLFTHTFTNASATGRTGPTLTQIQSAYSSTSWASDTSKLYMTTQGYQIWTVPSTGVYEIEVAGARGGEATQYTNWNGAPYGTINATGGRGGKVSGRKTLTQGTKLVIIVGQAGGDAWGVHEACGGGGASWVLSENLATLHAVAGGGGGTNGAYYMRNTGQGGGWGDGTAVASDTYGGASGNYNSGGGAGWTTNGSGGYAGNSYQMGGWRPAAGAMGGDSSQQHGSSSYTQHGGFGGGGANGWHSGGGGGGYSGGDAVGMYTSPGALGGTCMLVNMTSTVYGGSHTGQHGYVKITQITSTSVTVPDKFAIWGINRDSDNDTQVLAAYSGTLASGNGKSDYWRNNNPPDLYWSYWGNDWHSNTQLQTISNGRQTDPGISTRVTSGHTGSVYLIAYGPASTIPATPPASNQPLYSFTSHTFTPAGATGRNGPTLTQCRNAYNVTWDTNTSFFNITTQGIQQWTVPATRTYTITCKGASGGQFGGGATEGFPGGGATMTATFSLTQGTILNIVVGQKPTTYYGSGWQGSPGGGASWVYTGSIGGSGLLMVAGGGGGTGHGSGTLYAGNGRGGNSGTDSQEAAIGATVGSGSWNSGGTGRITCGSSGNKGVGEGGRGTPWYQPGPWGGAAGGAGWNSDGQGDQSNSTGTGAAWSATTGGLRMLGGLGGRPYAYTDGGFGGGGGSGGWAAAGGGGGGYTGGGAGRGWNNNSWGGGGGGGSYIDSSGTNTTLTAGYDAISQASVHDGYVEIS